jgi:hypothetical protein
VRDVFYADNRDLVKWGVLLHLARQFGAGRILQVAYYRQERRWVQVEIDGRECPIPDEVIKHFRDVHDILRLNASASLSARIDLLDSQFSNDKRAAHLKEIAAAIGMSKCRPCIVFLDPDNGLGRKVTHVRAGELADIWERMRSEDVLVFYQHSHRNRTWLEIRRREFEDALRLPAGAARIARGGLLPSGKRFCGDVAFFFVQKAETVASAAES